MERLVGLQTNIKPHVRSKSTMCELPQTTDTGCQTYNQMVVRFLSSKKTSDRLLKEMHSFSSNTSETSTGEFSESDVSFSSNSSEDRRFVKMMNEKRISFMKYLIVNDPKMYIGIDKPWILLIELLSNRTSCDHNHVLLTLIKVKLNDSFSRLGDQFGISVSQASRIFSQIIGPLAHFLTTLIYCPDRESRMKNMPIPFRYNFSHVAAIIDAFEIEIEKPTNPVYEVLTWSVYKKANTLKYKIYCTPDGFINFVSIGYEG